MELKDSWDKAKAAAKKAYDSSTLDENIEEKVAQKVASWTKKGYVKNAGWIGLAAVGGLGLIDLMTKLDSKVRSEEIKHKQRRDMNKQIKQRNDSKLVKEAYNYKVMYESKPEDMVLPDTTGLTQELFKRRTNHSNTWGGKRY